MRTTLDIDEDVLLAVKDIARERGVSAGRVLSEYVRKAMCTPQELEWKNGVPLLPRRPGGGIVTPELVKRLMDEEW